MTEIRDNLMNSEIERNMPMSSSTDVSSNSSQATVILRHSPGTDHNRPKHAGHVMFGGQSIPFAREEMPINTLPRDRLSAVEPDLIQSVKSSTLGRNSSVPDMRVKDKSSKTDSSQLSPEDLRAKIEQDKAEMPPPPIVPPRRKKKAVSMGSLNHEQVGWICV